jgi:hypothetical protein
MNKAARTRPGRHRRGLNAAGGQEQLRACVGLVTDARARS